MLIGEQIKRAIRGKGLSMEDAANKLEMSRSTLHHKLNAADNDKEFQQLVQERLGISLTNPERNSATVAIAERVVGNVSMKYHTVTLKDKRMAEMWLPADFSKKDIETLRNWLSFVETTL